MMEKRKRAESFYRTVKFSKGIQRLSDAPRALYPPVLAWQDFLSGCLSCRMPFPPAARLLIPCCRVNSPPVARGHSTFSYTPGDLPLSSGLTGFAEQGRSSLVNLSHFRPCQEALLSSRVFFEDTCTELAQPTRTAAGLVSWAQHSKRREYSLTACPYWTQPGLEVKGKRK